MKAKCYPLLAVVTFLLLMPVLSAAGDSWKDALKDSLRSKYELAKFGGDRIRITQPGTVLVIQKNGIVGDLATDATYSVNKIKDGKIAQASGFAAVMQNKKTSRVFKPGETVYVTKIDVKDDEVHYYLMSCDTFDVSVQGSTRQTRYIALLKFQFPNGFLESANADGVEKVADTVIAPEAEIRASATKSVELGQTPEEVETSLGKPEKIVNLGSKVVYVYKDMKIVFVDGKVADVQ